MFELAFQSPLWRNLECKSKHIVLKTYLRSYYFLKRLVLFVILFTIKKNKIGAFCYSFYNKEK